MASRSSATAVTRKVTSLLPQALFVVFRWYICLVLLRRRNKRRCIAKAFGDQTSIARSLETTFELSLVGDSAETVGFFGCQAQL
jgi:hypothetical protein